jgi:hypothetical protein
MTRVPIALFLVGLGFFIVSPPARALEEDSIPAFPGAEGFGRFAKGGRGGDVYHVTNLDDSGPGSLRQGVRTATGPRTIVFDLSGTIELKSDLVVEKSCLTIAGQTAPGDGICLKDHTFKLRKVSHIIVRYLRIRLGDKNKKKPAGDDAITTNDVDYVIFDHISTSWGIDANHDLRRGGHFTLQWSIYAEALHDSIHEKGPHAMLGSFREITDSITLHHNLFASSRERHPTLAGGSRTNPEAVVDFRNNVVYNVVGATNLGNCRINFVDNFYQPGPNSPQEGKPIAAKVEREGVTHVFMRGNVFAGSQDWTKDNYRAINFDRWTDGGYLRTTLEKIRWDKEFSVGAAKPSTHSAVQAYDLVLGCVGDSLFRDDADRRLVKGVRKGTHRMIDSQDQVGGWPALRSRPALLDSDGDGIPDAWEQAHGLNPKDSRDGNLRDKDGFTNLEKYLNSLCPPTPVVPSP